MPFHRCSPSSVSRWKTVTGWLGAIPAAITWEAMPAGIASQVLDAGIAPSQPVTVFQRLTLEGEQRWNGTLQECAEIAEEFSDLSIMVFFSTNQVLD